MMSTVHLSAMMSSTRLVGHVASNYPEETMSYLHHYWVPSYLKILPRLSSSQAIDTGRREQIQQAFPQARVVKSLNTMNVSMMFGQQSHPGHHNVFMAENEANASGKEVTVARSLADAKSVVSSGMSAVAPGINARGEGRWVADFFPRSWARAACLRSGRRAGPTPGTPPRGVSSGDTSCQPARSSGAPG